MAQGLTDHVWSVEELVKNGSGILAYCTPEWRKKTGDHLGRPNRLNEAGGSSEFKAYALNTFGIWQQKNHR